MSGTEEKPMNPSKQDDKKRHDGKLKHSVTHSFDISDHEKIWFWLKSRHDDGDPVLGAWSKDLLSYIELVSIEPAQPYPKVVFSFTCQHQHGNRGNKLHGGATASLFDTLTTMALVPVSRPGFWQWLGVSRTLNVTYLRPVPVGVETLIECEVLQIGKYMCALKGVMRRKSDGKVLAVCEHNKVSTDADVAKL